MTRLLDVLAKRRSEERSAWPELPWDEFTKWFTYGSHQYNLAFSQSLGTKVEEIGASFRSLTNGAYRNSSVVFAVEATRLLHFSEVRFAFRQLRNGIPGNLFGTQALSTLEQPWPGGTTGDLLMRMLAHADLAGNAFVAEARNGLKILRPDWVTIVCGSPNDADVVAWDPDSELLGYIYHPGGRFSGRDPVAYMADEVAHFAPIPDPESEYRGMSWLTPVIREVMSDQAATEHKLAFFENGATPNMVISLGVSDPEKLRAWTELFREKYEGKRNAYKTMFLGAGADPTVVGSNFQQLDFKQTVGVAETRIAAAGGVPAVVVGLSEGLQGSSLNAGNYAAARRRFADGTMRPLWRNVAGSLARVVDVPRGAELWYDARDVPFLREDEEVEAEILRTQSVAMRQLIDAGFKADTVVDAITSGDLSRLQHTNLFSVQLQPAGTSSPNGATSSSGDDAGAGARALVRRRQRRELT